jgi:hypothetical protein
MTNDYEQLADAEQASRSVFMAEIAALKADLRRLEEENERLRKVIALSTEPQGHEDWLEASNRHAEAAGKILAEAHEQCTVPDCLVCTARPTSDARAEEKR